MTLAFARFDLRSWFPRRQTLLPLAFIALVGIVLPVPGMAIGAAGMIIGTLTAVRLYAGRELR
ncbi:hypothetical protein [uncultured Microbacterium sp.]|uniref:hypothetical protein n=1 Tax=uncultured Microbacterium sp. TaxID=191216 RepID=UPI0028D56C5C|nr:hypothetical protein [uncultured Microbacterium sp.]